jgi:ParB/RepB/Spo0J family partition protein
MEFVDPEKVYMGKNNPRLKVDGIDIGSNIRERRKTSKRGIVVPIIVKKYEGDLEGFQYEVIDGKRRLQAALMTREETIPFVLETQETDRTEQMIIAFEANALRKEFNWIEKAMFFETMNKFGMTNKAIGRRFNLSESRISEYINTYKKYMPYRLRDPEALPMGVIKDIVNKCKPTDIETMMCYAVENKLNQKEVRRVIYGLNHYYKRISEIKDFNEDIAKELAKKYSAYKFNPKALVLFDKEADIRTGKDISVNKMLDIRKYPTKQSALKYAKENNAEFIGPFEIKGWKVKQLSTTIEDIDTKLATMKKTISIFDAMPLLRDMDLA